MQIRFNMKHNVEIELGIVEVINANWAGVDQFGQCYHGKKEHVTFLTAEGELKEFSTWEEWINTLPANAKFYRIGYTTNDCSGRRGYRFETRDTRKVTLVL